MWPYKAKILFQVTGSIAAYKACTVVSALVQDGHEVRVTTSTSALQFIGAATWEGLTGQPPASDLFAHGQAMDHIELARWADLIVVCPCTAHTLNKLSAGLADDLISSIFLANNFKKKCLLFPAMNSEMYLNPITQQSIAKLRELGVFIAPTLSGHLACGEVGPGRLLDTETILSQIRGEILKLNTNPGKHVLVTAGGTIEPLDRVRHIGNFSSGQTAATIADELRMAGHKVIYLCAENAIRPQIPGGTYTFVTFQDLSKQLKQLVRSLRFDFVVHAAAVSDFSLTHVTKGKINSQGKFHTLQLKRNPKLVEHMLKWSGQQKTKIIAFKLTSERDQTHRLSQAEQLLKVSGVTAVVLNDVTDISAEKHAYKIVQKNRPTLLGASKLEMAGHVRQLVEMNL